MFVPADTFVLYNRCDDKKYAVFLFLLCREMVLLLFGHRAAKVVPNLFASSVSGRKSKISSFCVRFG